MSECVRADLVGTYVRMRGLDHLPARDAALLCIAHNSVRHALQPQQLDRARDDLLALVERRRTRQLNSGGKCKVLVHSKVRVYDV